MTTAQQKNAPDDRWFLISTADLDYASFKTACAEKHKANAPGTQLSVTLNLDGTQALVNVSGCKDWEPSVGTVLKTYTPVDHYLVQALVRTVEWATPIGGEK
ncbi:MAG: hypothetical protein NUW01_18465 [Gemmatimonadaceae bacterium]|nr:hypothetical protein [Gemmatimonadaceae bacterium]